MITRGRNISQPAASVSVEMRVARTPQPKRGAGGSAEWTSSLRRGLSRADTREHDGLICVSLRTAFAGRSLSLDYAQTVPRCEAIRCRWGFKSVHREKDAIDCLLGIALVSG
ncbi:MAG: hypothetical protein JWR09_5783, partial [Mucilaginibacter sp.]|nr:hypothetical protein [Mucilaginibacter sp.]